MEQLNPTLQGQQKCQLKVAEWRYFHEGEVDICKYCPECPQECPNKRAKDQLLLQHPFYNFDLYLIILKFNTLWRLAHLDKKGRIQKCPTLRMLRINTIKISSCLPHKLKGLHRLQRRKPMKLKSSRIKLILRNQPPISIGNGRIDYVEEQTKEIEKWAQKYQNLQQKNQQLQQRNQELEQIVQLLKTQSQQEIKSTESLPSKRFYQSELGRNENKFESDEKNFISQSKLQSKQDEINQLKLQLGQLKQELLEEKQIHRELLEAEETRVREQERKNFNQYKLETKEQLLLYKNEIQALQDMLENKQMVNKQDNFEEKNRQLNLQILEKNKKIEQLESLIAQKDSQINQLQQQLEKYQKEQVQLIKQQQSQKQLTLPSSSSTCRVISTQHSSLDNNYSSLVNINKTNSIQDQINQTMAQINRSIQQVDQMKQTSSVNQKLYQEQFNYSNIPSSLRSSQMPQMQSNLVIQDKMKILTSQSQQYNSQNYNKYI
ncbi:unnamed protein product (macronuclear) [Paramecium tetraurelia]|uniref:non-specific serine/threonine protein kinase n=1 Tax=Paramecium tetraurelia TaxID=5888 RepID=A0BSZ3_PARTE|nr:uncharacterized protein GSPATT00031892001 [Paramecium tetraurelia]CAK61660.1 unnamed protein product [Paramecium tetraurelia]|eukprot:XP_001429058.1 hypothetical protein (macronuclear) [Paramecium tetraurelia strain d4-2]